MSDDIPLSERLFFVLLSVLFLFWVIWRELTDRAQSVGRHIRSSTRDVRVRLRSVSRRAQVRA